MIAGFIGPSYTLAERKADVQRAVNLYLQPVESGTGKGGPAILKSVSGLVEFADLGAAVRGAFCTVDGRLYAVGGQQVFRVLSDGTASAIGTTGAGSGPVQMGQNTSLAFIVDGSVSIYTMDLSTQAVTLVTDPDCYGSSTLAMIDGYALFIRPDTGQFYITGPNDATFDALDFATAEGAPDKLVAVVADHREAWLFGTQSTEVWFNSGDVDFPFSRNNSAFLEHGCAAAQSAVRVGEYVMWLGQSSQGAGQVFIAQGYQARRVSTVAVEQAFAGKTLTDARAYAYHDSGHDFYCLNVTGCETTWCYDLLTGAWHERAELVNGAYQQHRATCHAFAFGYHIFGAADGKLYRMDASAYTNAGDVLVRDRVSPHQATPMLDRAFFGTFEIDASAGDAPSGTAPLVSMRYSNDGGRTWGAWRTREVGRIGEFGKRVRWTSNGAAFDRVWQVRCTDNAPFSLISARVAA